MQKRGYRPGTRAARFTVLRDAILSQGPRMHSPKAGQRELRCGPFRILYVFPRHTPSGRFNIQIWPAGGVAGRHIVYANKVANVDWDQHGNVDIISYKSGAWEAQLIELLRHQGTVTFI